MSTAAGGTLNLLHHSDQAGSPWTRNMTCRDTQVDQPVKGGWPTAGRPPDHGGEVSGSRIHRPQPVDPIRVVCGGLFKAIFHKTQIGISAI